MWFAIGLVVGLAAGYVVFRLYWVDEINAGRSALAQAKQWAQGVGKKL